MKSRLFALLTSLALLCAATLSHAQVPRTINYQGYLTTPTGAPVTSAGMTMVFNLYSVATSGSALHSETQTVAVSNGIFNVLLGTATPLTLPFDVQYYLGVTAGSDPEMSPRQPLAASPYAIRALAATSAATADALAPAATVQGSQISNASITSSKLASNGCSSTQVLQYNGTAWVCANLPAGGAGTVTSVTAGVGLTGGVITGSGTLAVDTVVVQRRVNNSCPVGSSIRVINVDGTVTCQTDTGGGSGTVTSIVAGEGLTGGTITGSGTIAVNPSAVQSRVSASCPDGSSIRAIGSDGSVTCQQAGSTNVATPLANVVNTVMTTGDVGKFSALAIGPDGFAIIAYYNATTDSLMLIRCENLACSSTTPATTVDTGGGQNISLAIGADGNPLIAYQGSSPIVIRCTNATCSTKTRSAFTSSSAGTNPSIAVAADGLPMIATGPGSGGTLRLIKCGNAACSSGNVINTVAGVIGLLSGVQTSLALAPDGLPAIAFSGPSPMHEVSFVKCRNASCTDIGQGGVSVTPSHAEGQFVSLTFGEDGLPVMSYALGSLLNQIGLTKCGTPDCLGQTNKVLDATSASVGKHSAITVGVDGVPVVSYYDATNGELKVARCSDPSCSGVSNAVSVTNVAADVGQYTSIGIAGDGLPIISYYDVTNGDLKVAKCTNVFCSPYFKRR